MVAASKVKHIVKTPTQKKQHNKFSICLHPSVLDEDIFEVQMLEKYLRERIKVNGKTKNLGRAVHLERQKNGVNVNTSIKFSKRYLKYLTKKFLKKNKIRDYLRIVSDSKNSYELRFYNFGNDDSDSEEK